MFQHTLRFTKNCTRRFYGFACMLGIALVMATPASAFLEVDRTEHVFAGSSIGFAVLDGEATFLTNLEGDFFFTHNLSLGGQMLFSTNSDVFAMGMQGVAKYTFDLRNVDSWLEPLKPHTQILMGLLIVDAPVVDTSAGFLGGFGFGADYFLNSRLAVGTDMLFQFSSEAAVDFGFFWKFANVKYLF